MVVRQDGCGDELAVGDHLVVVVAVALGGGGEGGYGAVELPQKTLHLGGEFFVVWYQDVGYAHVVVFQLPPQGCGAVGRCAGHQLLQQVGGLAHGRHNDHQRLWFHVCLHDVRHVAHRLGAVHRRAAELKYFH